MTIYDPHASPDMAAESAVASKGRLVKARLPDQPAPNVSWFWVTTGNCLSCRHYVPAGAGRPPRCLNPGIPDEQFRGFYIFTNECPGFAHGVSPQTASENPALEDVADVMRAAGLAPGRPRQRVEILVSAPWSVALALRAHREQSTFLDMAMQADSGEDNSPAKGEYVDMLDDLEGKGGEGNIFPGRR